MYGRKRLDIISIQTDKIELGIQTGDEILQTVELTDEEVKHLIMRLVNLL
jgi:hypothetical protein